MLLTRIFRSQATNSPGRLAAELVEVAVGLEKRLLDDVRRADPDPQPVVELGRDQQLQIVGIERQQPAQAGGRTLPGRTQTVCLSHLARGWSSVESALYPVIMGRFPGGLSPENWKFAAADCYLTAISQLRRYHGT